MKTSNFQQVLEAVESLPLDDREILLDIVQKRLHQKRRTQIVQEIAEIRQEYAEGKVQFGSLDDFLAALDEE